MSRLFALFATIAALACAADPEPRCECELNVDSSFTEEELAGIVDAAAAWNAVLGYEAVSFGDGGLPVEWRDEPEDRENNIAALGNWDGERIWIATPKNLDPYLLTRRIAAHEIGHVFGLGHTEDGVMSGLSTPDLWILLPTEADAALACQ